MKRAAGRAISTVWTAAVLAVLGAWAGRATGWVPTAWAAEDGADVALVSVCRRQLVASMTSPAHLTGSFVLTVGNVGTAATDGDKPRVGMTQLQKTGLFPVPPGPSLGRGAAAEGLVTWDVYRKQPFRVTARYLSDPGLTDNDHSLTFARPQAVPSC